MPVVGRQVAEGFRTYDVFDTVLTRMVGAPTSAFLLLGERIVRSGLWSGTGEQFLDARVIAESVARAHSSTGEVDLAAIYHQIAFCFGLDDARCRAIAQEELELEEVLLRAVPETARRLESDRRQKLDVGFISDMYLPSATIRRWLIQAGAARQDDLLWVSCEEGRTKGRGDLFDLVAQQVAVSPKVWRHLGDNLRADIESPQSRGIGAEHYVGCHLTPAEDLMEGFGRQTCGISSLMAGASRWTRLTFDPRASQFQLTLNDYAAEVAGPALYAFLLWVVRVAQAKGVSRIWFMARDGQVMIPIARTIAERLNIKLEFGYLYGGRQIVKLAALRVIDDAALEWMLQGADSMTLDAVLERVGISMDDELSALSMSCGLQRDRPVGSANVVSLKKFFRKAVVTARILDVAKKRRAVVIDYFRQCGLVDGEPSCVVDLGWRGTVVNAVDQLIGRAQSQRHHYLYFGLRSRPEGTAGLSMQGYLFDVDGRQARGFGDQLGSMSTLMETFCQADHGPVMQIARNGDIFEPILRSPDDAPQGEWDVKLFQQRLLTFAQAVMMELAPNRVVDLRPLVAALLKRSLNQPTVPEARLFETLRFSDGPEGSTPQAVNRAYRWQDALAAYRDGGWPWFGMNWWLPGAIVLTPRPTQLMIRVAAKVGRTVRAGRRFRYRFT